MPHKFLREEHSYGNSSDDDASNMIIQADNLEALKALLPHYRGKVKCICTDPPYNTGSAFEHYNDKMEHSIWLSMMYPRLELMHELLADDGSLWINIDDDECHYLKVLMDEVFERRNFIGSITVLMNPKGRSMDKYFSTCHEFLLVYSKNPLEKGVFSVAKTESEILNEYPFEDERGRYNLIELRNTHREFNRKTRSNLFYPVYVDKLGNTALAQDLLSEPEPICPIWNDGLEGCWTWDAKKFRKDHRDIVARKIKGKWKIYRKRRLCMKKQNTIWLNEKQYLNNGKYLACAECGTDIDVLWTDGTEKAKKEVRSLNSESTFSTPKPERLIQRILTLATKEGDLVLDAFLGSGTTAAVAHKMNRRYIGIEKEDTAKTHACERLKKVIAGEQGGISKDVGWKGGGGFRFYTLADDDCR